MVTAQSDGPGTGLGGLMEKSGRCVSLAAPRSAVPAVAEAELYQAYGTNRSDRPM